jgi:hypothetical protein
MMSSAFSRAAVGLSVVNHSPGSFAIASASASTWSTSAGSAFDVDRVDADDGAGAAHHVIERLLARTLRYKLGQCQC